MVNSFDGGLIWADQYRTSMHAGGGAAEMVVIWCAATRGEMDLSGMAGIRLLRINNWELIFYWLLRPSLLHMCPDLRTTSSSTTNGISILSQSFLNVLFWAHGLHIDPIDVLFPFFLDFEINMVVLLTNSAGANFVCFPTLFKKKGEWKLHIL